MRPCGARKFLLALCGGLVALTLNFASGQGIAPPIAKIGSPLNAGNRLAASADTLVLCPEDWVDELDSWVDYRQSQGHIVYVISPAGNAYGIKRQIRQLVQYGNLKHVVIVGDSPDRLNQRTVVSTDYVRAEVVSKYGSEPVIATDNTFADCNGDGVPDVAIGRIPVKTTEQLREQIRKIVNYESRSQPGPWKRRINFVAGTGGFGPLSDHVIEKTSKKFITDLIPASFDTSMTYASWCSAYCPDPRKFVDTTVERLNEGCLFWVYMGHGHPHRLDYVRTPAGGFPIFGQQDLKKVDCRLGLPVAIMLSCYTGAFDMPGDCLGEQLVRLPRGPIAVLGGTRVTTPYGMSIFSLGLIDEYFDGEHATLGQLFLAAKQRLMEEAKLDDDESATDMRHAIELLGKALSPTADELDRERYEHLQLFHLLGDPLLRLPRPESLTLSTPAEAASGKRIAVSGQAPHAGQLVLKLDYARDRMHIRPPRRSEFVAEPQALASYQEIYQKANCKTCCQIALQVSAGPFQAELEIPEWARGRCVISGYLDDGEQFSLGAENVLIKQR